MAPAPDDHLRRKQILLLLTERLGFATREEADEALAATRGRDAAALLDWLVGRALLTADERIFLDRVTDELIRAHGGDALAAFNSLIGAGVAPDPNAPTVLFVDPTTEDRYRFQRSLSPQEDGAEKGGMGDVLVAEDRLIGRQVVVKQIRADRSHHEDYRKRFHEETRITGILEHPNIVPMYDAGTHGDGRSYYVMRYIAGDTLSQAIRRYHPRPPGQTAAARSLALRDLLRRFVDVCEAVSFAHSRGYIHRDIKPGNILLGAFGETHLIDWGLVMRFARPGIDPGEGTRSTAAATQRRYDNSGTLPYKAPEQEEGNVERFGPHTDIYGLGATLYHLLTGKHAFADASEPANVSSDVVRGVFPRPRQVNREVAPALEAICLKAMARAPEDRYRSAKALAEDIERVLADQPVAVYQDPVTVRAARFARRHRTTLAAAAVLLVTSVIGLAANNVLVGLERDKARAAERTARVAEQRATKNADIASEVIDNFVYGFLDDLWATIPGSVPKRVEVLSGADAKYRELVEQEPDDAFLLRGSVKIAYALGTLQAMMEDDEAGWISMTRAMAKGSQLATSESSTWQDWVHHALSLSKGGEMVRSREGPNAAAPFFEEALEWIRRTDSRSEEFREASRWLLPAKVCERAINQARRGMAATVIDDMKEACAELSTLAMSDESPGKQVVIHSVLFNSEATEVALSAERFADALQVARVAEAESRSLVATMASGDALYVRAMALLHLGMAERANGTSPEAMDDRLADAVAAARMALDSGAHRAASTMLFAEAVAMRARNGARRSAQQRIAELEGAIREIGLLIGNSESPRYELQASIGSLATDLAAIHHEAGHGPETVTEARRALALLEPLSRTNPADPIISLPIREARSLLGQP